MGGAIGRSVGDIVPQLLGFGGYMGYNKNCPRTFGTRGYRGYNENDLPGD